MIKLVKKIFPVVIVFVTLGTEVKWLIGNAGNPPNGGAEQPMTTANCAGCHTSAALTQNSADLTLSGLPSTYVPGTAYPLTFSIVDGVAGANGFQLTVQRTDTSANVSNWSGAGAGSAVDGNYWEHSSAGTGTSWTVTWTAPAAGTGNVRIFSVVNKGGTSPGGNLHRQVWDIPEETAPANVGFTGVAVDSVTVTWDLRSGNSYVMALSQVSDFSSVASSGTGSLNQNTTTYSALNPNTTYFFKVKISTHPDALYSTTISTLTLPRSPAAASFQIFNTSLSVTLNPSGNQSGTTLSITSGTFELSNSSSGISGSGNTILVISNLFANTTYTIQTRAVGFTNIASSATLVTTTSTLADPPDFLTFFSTEVALSSMTVRWNQKSNPSTVRYKIEISTDSSFTGAITSSTTFTLFLTTATLFPNTTYYFRGTALNNNLLGNSFTNQAATATLSNPPASAASTFTFLSASQITAQWDANNNPAQTTYIAEVSTVSNFASGTVTSSTTFLVSVTTAGLISDTTYFFRVKSRNFAGLDTNFVNIGSTKTLAITDTIPPANISDLTALTGIIDGQILLNWTSPGNNGESGSLNNANYRVHAATISFSSFTNTMSATQFGAFDYDNTFSTTGVAPGTKVGTVVNGLYPGTTWYLAVIVQDDNNNWNFWNKSGSFNRLSSAPAQDLILPAPTGIFASSLSSQTIVIEWTVPSAPSGFDDRDKYRLYTATSTFSTGTESWVRMSSEVAHPLSQAATVQLTANTTYFFKVSALDSGDKGDGRYSVAFESFSAVLYSTVTSPPSAAVPAAPSGFRVADISANSITFSWTINSTNEDGFRVLNSTGGLLGSVGAGATSLALTGLAPNSLVQASGIAAFNSAGASTQTAFISSYTWANPPSNPAFSGGTQTQVTIFWSSNSNPSTVLYEVSQSTDNFVFAAGISTPVPFSSNLTSTSTIISGLTAGGTYWFRIRARNSDSVVTAFSISITTVTQAAQVILSTGGTLSAGGTTLTADAGVTITNNILPDGSTQQTLLSTQTATAIYGNGLSLELPSGVQTKVVATANGLTLTSTQTVPVRESGVLIQATSGTMNIESSATSLTISIASGSTQNVQASISTESAKSVSIRLNPPTGEISLDLPRAVFAESAAVRIKLPENFPSAPAVGRGAKGLGIGVEILLDKPIQPQRTVPITMNFRDSDIAGVNPNSLILSRFDETAQLWTLLPTTIDLSSRKVVGKTNHFSKFQLMSISPAADISGVKVFPNPFLASKGDAEIKFTNLPADTSVKIYTLLGQFVRELRTDATGRAFWDLKNSGGEEVASDIYLAMIEGEGGKKVLKVGVQR